MLTDHRLRRLGAILPLIAVMLATSLLALPVAAGEPPPMERRATADRDRGTGGSTQGAVACVLEVASSDEFFGSSALAVPDEDILVWGEGWAPDGIVELGVQHPTLGSDVFPTLSDPSGVFFEVFFADRGAYGPWTFTAEQLEPACTSNSVVVDVLPLADVLDNKFLHDIKWLYHEGITSGCGGDLYCPDGSVTRGQMATFLVRALGLPPTATDFFTDDTGNKHESNINRLAEAGITVGCTPTTYCPDGLVTRGQMATFLTRAFDLGPTSTDYFTDDAGNKHEGNINRLRAARITYGCSETRYCPDGNVTRGQMAAFIHRANR